MELKTCPKCKEIKPFSEFYKCKTAKNGCSPYCKVCSNLRTTSYAKQNKDKIQPLLAGYALKRRYGITVQDYENMLLAQNKQCAICGTTECSSGRNFAVDHCHTTGKIRGLLCSACNIGLGKFRDNPEVIKKAIEYLKQNENSTTGS